MFRLSLKLQLFICVILNGGGKFAKPIKAREASA